MDGWKALCCLALVGLQYACMVQTAAMNLYISCQCQVWGHKGVGQWTAWKMKAMAMWDGQSDVCSVIDCAVAEVKVFHYMTLCMLILIKSHSHMRTCTNPHLALSFRLLLSSFSSPDHELPPRTLSVSTSILQRCYLCAVHPSSPSHSTSASQTNDLCPLF